MLYVVCKKEHRKSTSTEVVHKMMVKLTPVLLAVREFFEEEINVKVFTENEKGPGSTCWALYNVFGTW